MSTLSPYLRFNDNKCKEAMNFYKSCFGGELSLQTIGETQMGKDMPAEAQSKIMHAELKSGNIHFYGADMMRDKAVIGDQVSITIDSENETELRDLFSKLGQGGEIFMPIDKQFWGGLFGVLTDKYGIEWMFSCMNPK